MTTDNQLPQSFNLHAVAKRALQGAGLALALVVSFLAFVLIAAEDARLGIWVLTPMLTVTFAGACGGIFFHLLSPARRNGGWKKAVANTASFLVYIVALYLSLVIGLAIVGLWD
jgi:hypothetical protein